MLFIGIKDDSAITISKINKIRTTTIQQKKKELNEELDNTKTQKNDAEFINPLDGLNI